MPFSRINFLQNWRTRLLVEITGWNYFLFILEIRFPVLQTVGGTHTHLKIYFFTLKVGQNGQNLCLVVKWHLWPTLRGKCTLKQNWACFVSYLKFIYTFLKKKKRKKNINILRQIVLDSQKWTISIIGQTIQNIVLITQELLCLYVCQWVPVLHFSDNFLHDAYISKQYWWFWESTQNKFNFDMGCSSPLSHTQVYFRGSSTPLKVLAIDLWFKKKEGDVWISCLFNRVIL